MLQPGATLNDRYRLDGHIGAGGMGEVWLATDTVLHRPVAVKVLPAALLEGPDSVRRFRAEARVMAALRHPGIAAIHDFGDSLLPGGGRAVYLVMEYVAGRPLYEVLTGAGRLDAARVMSIVAQAGHALQAAHDLGIVHRDVKPANLLVKPDGAVVLVDFGVARSEATTRLTATNVVLGTVRYMAPEQASGRAVTPAADVYSLGAVAYHCLNGDPPFTGDSPLGIVAQHVHNDPRPLSAAIPAAVRAVVERALRKDPADRYPGGAAMARAAAEAGRLATTAGSATTTAAAGSATTAGGSGTTTAGGSATTAGGSGTTTAAGAAAAAGGTGSGATTVRGAGADAITAGDVGSGTATVRAAGRDDSTAAGPAAGAAQPARWGGDGTTAALRPGAADRPPDRWAAPVRSSASRAPRLIEGLLWGALLGAAVWFGAGRLDTVRSSWQLRIAVPVACATLLFLALSAAVRAAYPATLVVNEWGLRFRRLHHLQVHDTAVSWRHIRAARVAALDTTEYGVILHLHGSPADGTALTGCPYIPELAGHLLCPVRAVGGGADRIRAALRDHAPPGRSVA